MTKPRGYSGATREQIRPKQRAEIKAACESGLWPLILAGSVGTGKTCAAAVIYGCFGQLPMWYRADDLLMSMAIGRSGSVRVEAMNDLGELVTSEIQYNKFVGRITNRSAVFLDDLGTRKSSEATYQALFDLLEWRKGRPLIITTNKTLAELAALYDDRIADRLAAGSVVKFTGPSRRRKA